MPLQTVAKFITFFFLTCVFFDTLHYLLWFETTADGESLSVEARFADPGWLGGADANYGFPYASTERLSTSDYLGPATGHLKGREL